MTSSLTPRSAAALLAAAALAACGRSSIPPRTAPEPASSTTDYVALARARADSARHRYVAADVRFMSAMIGHHSQAIIMSRMAPTHGASPAVQVLAARIINAQRDEIATMQGWLRDRGQPVPEAKPAPMRMTMGGMEHEMLMPGMLTDAQLAQLDSARGERFDELFLTRMIGHHQGAVSMVKDLFGSYGAGQDEAVFKFASDVNVDQTTEIARMQRMLAALLFRKPAP